MPIYEYNCTRCRKHFEIFQKITDSRTAKCPECSHPAGRVISQTSFALKGGGWYKDGYTAKKADNREQKTENRGEKAEKKKEEK